MPSTFWRLALPLAAALTLLASAACGDAQNTSTRLSEAAVDSTNPRAHRLARLVERVDTLSMLTQALRQTGLLKELRLEGPYTLFAPTNGALQRSLAGFDSLLAPAGSSSISGPGAAGAFASRGAASPDNDSLRSLLQFHLVRGRFTTSSLKDSLRLGTMLPGKSFVLERGRSNRSALRIRVREMRRPVRVRRTLEAQNGVLHVLTRALHIPTPDTSVQGALGDTTTASAGN